MNKDQHGSLTLLSLMFLLVISALLSYQIASYRSRLLVNRVLIQGYVNGSGQNSK